MIDGRIAAVTLACDKATIQAGNTDADATAKGTTRGTGGSSSH